MIWETLANFPAEQLLAFMAGALVLNLAPGPDVLFASACGIQHGPRAGVLAGLGVGLGVVCHVVLATLGLGALIALHPGALSAIRYAGAGYLLFLAWKSWTAGGAEPRTRAAARPWAIVRRGAVSNLLNPKPVLFLLAFLPQFTRLDYGPAWQQIMGLGLMFALSGMVVTMGYGLLAGHAGQAIGRRLRAVNRIAALIFAGLALRLVWK